MTDRPRIALSHSRLSDFNQCPLMFKLKYIDKPQNFVDANEDGNKSPHLVRGKNIHQQLEKYVAKKAAGENGIPPSTLPEVENGKPIVDEFVRTFARVIPETQVSINDQWKQVDWYSRESYFRAIWDLTSINPTLVRIDDWKTGKFKDYTPENGYGQLELSATIALNLWPEVERVAVSYLYLEHKKKIEKSYTQADRERMTKHFVSEHEKVNAETEFKPKRNNYCGFCAATKPQCPYSRKL